MGIGVQAILTPRRAVLDGGGRASLTTTRCEPIFFLNKPLDFFIS